MLLIDPGRSAVSLHPAATPYPYRPAGFSSGVVAAAGYLARSGGVERLLPVLVHELRGLGILQRLPASLPGQVARVAAHAISHGAIPVGVPLMGDHGIVFEASRPEMPDDIDAIRFGGQAWTEAFLTRCLTRDTSLAAVNALIAHPRSAGHGLPADRDDQIRAIAALLMCRRLGLFPARGSSYNELQIAWIREYQLLKVAPPPPPPPPPPSPIAQIIQAVVNALPGLPADVSPQAQALIDAANNGTAFCEECAKAAAGV